MINLIKEKFKNNRDSFQLYLGNSIVSVFTFLSIALLSHFLIPDEYGSFRYMLMVMSIAVSLGTLGFSQAIFYFLNTSKTAQLAYDYINALRVGMLISSVVVVLLLSIYLWVTNSMNSFFDWNKYYIWVVLLIIPGIFQSAELNMFLSMRRVGAYFINTLTIQTIKLGLIFIAFTVKASLIHYVLILAVTGVAPTIINNIYIQRFFKDEHFAFHKELLRNLWRYGLPIGIGLFFGVIMTHTDKLLLSYLLNDSVSIACISNGNFEVPLITVFYTSFSAIAFPFMLKAYNDGNIKELLRVRNNYQREVTLILYPIVVALIAWSPSFIPVVFGSDYQSSAVFFAIYAITFFYRFNSYHDIFLITNKTKYISIIQGIELVFHIGLTYVLISKYGLIGASIAHLITNTIYAFVCTLISKIILKVRMLDIIPFWYLYKIVFIATVMMFPFYFVSFYFKSDIVRILIAGVYVVTSILLLYKLESKKEEVTS